MTEVIVSSDDDEILSVARSFGIAVPFRRPAELARDDCLVIDVILHALTWLTENQGKTFDYVCLLQPTSPFGRASDYDRAIRKAIDEEADTVISVYCCDQVHPAIMFTLSEDSRAEWYIKDPRTDRMARRQDLPPVYVRSGIVYVFKTSLLVARRTLYGEKIYAIEVPRERAIGVDTPHDLRIAELLAQEYLRDKDNT
jgi:CMP-N-acetylneuraminic acid synthetase